MKQSRLHAVRYLMLATCLASVALAHATTQIELSFGITPHQSPTELGKNWVPISQYLSQRTGYQIQFKTSKDLSAFLKDAEAGVFDLLYINPYYFTKAQKAAGYSVTAKDGGTPLIGIIVARKDGPKNIKSLQGAKIATHDVAAFMTSYVRYGYLQDNGVQIEPVGVGSLESVYLTIDKGLFPAGISIQRAFGLLDPEKQAHFNILWKSDPLPPFAYAAHPRVAPNVIEQVRQALLAMGENTEGRALLSKVNIKAIIPASDKDFDAMRRLKME
jgi:phosphonate transport system substrate-binding protein